MQDVREKGLDELRSLYRAVAEDLAAHPGLFCEMSGRCCRFKEAEHELFLTGLEFEEMVAHTIYPEAEQLVREHEAAGHVVAIVSGATKFVVRPLARRLGIQHWLYTRLEVEDGAFTGRVVEPICFEEGKIYWLQQFMEEQGLDLAKSFFYTDSITDLPLLNLVGHPVATNPDPLLYRQAVRRRWPVRFFEPPG